MSDDQKLEHVKEYLPQKIESEIDDIDTGTVKTRGLVLLFRVELPQLLTHLCLHT